MFPEAYVWGCIASIVVILGVIEILKKRVKSNVIGYCGVEIWQKTTYPNDLG